MPVEIKELIIRAYVGPGSDGGQDEPADDDDGGGPASGGGGLDTSAIVQACVREVLRVLARERER